MPTTVPVNVTVTVAGLLATEPAIAVTVKLPGAIDENAPLRTTATSLGEIDHDTLALTSAVWPSWNVPSAFSCVVAPGGVTGYWSERVVIVGVSEMLVSPWIGGGPESPPNPPESSPASTVAAN